MPKTKLLTAALIFFILFIFNLKILYPTITGSITPLLIILSNSLNVTDKVGYPLFSIFAKIFSVIPLADLPFKYNLFSGFIASLCGVLLFFSLIQLTHNTSISLLSTFLFVFSPVIHKNFMHAALLPLFTVLFCFNFYLIVLSVFRNDSRQELLAIFIAIFCLTLHPVGTVCFVLTTMNIACKKKQEAETIHILRSTGLKPLTTVFLLAFIISIASIILLYILLRPSLPKITIDSSDTIVLPLLPQFTILKQYAPNIFLFENFKNMLLSFYNFYTGNYRILIFILCIIGIFFLKQKNFAFTLQILAAIPLLILVFALSPHKNISFYFTSLFIFVSIFISLGLACIVGKVGTNNTLKYSISLFILLFIYVNLFSNIFQYINRINKSRSNGLYYYGYEFFTTSMKDSLVFVDKKTIPFWHILYFQQVENMRQDMMFLFPSQFSDKSYRENIRQIYNKKLPFPSEKEFKRIQDNTFASLLPIDAEEIQKKLLSKKVADNLNILIQMIITGRSIFSYPAYFTSVRDIAKTRFRGEFNFIPDYFRFHVSPRPLYIGLSNILLLKRFLPHKEDHIAQSSAQFFSEIGEMLLQQKEYRNAMEFFKTSIQLDKNNIESHLFIGFIYKKFSKYNKAAYNFKTAIKILEQKIVSEGAQEEYILLLMEAYNQMGIETEIEKYKKMLNPNPNKSDKNF